MPTIPQQLAAACQSNAERQRWLAQLPHILAELQQRWALTLGQPFEGEEVSCAWVAPVKRQNGAPAILKVGIPHMEAEDEIEGLRFWAGNPTVELLGAEESLNAMLLERCQPGTHLRHLPEAEQDFVIASLLRRLWRQPSTPHHFRPLAVMTAHWAVETQAGVERWPDRELVSEGLRLFEQLAETTTAKTLLATDLHAGNVLRAQRERWLVIDPKPFVGDPAFDATQHLLNCYARLRAEPDRTIRTFADLLQIDRERVRLWTFARAALQSGNGGPTDRWSELAQALRP